MKTKNEMKKKLLRFCITGGCTTLIDGCIYWFLSREMDIFLSKAGSMLFASVFSYSLNKAWTFKNTDRRHKKYLWKYYITFAVNAAVNSLINLLAYRSFGKKLLAFVIATACAAGVNFVLQSFWVFRIKEEKS